MSVELETQRLHDDSLPSDYAQYKALCMSAVASAAIGALSIVSFFNWALAVIPVLGVVTGLVALVRIRRNSAEMTGSRVAWTGIVLSLVFAAFGLGYQAYSYATELPPGYERLSYASLQPNPDDPGEVYPPDVMQYDGKQMFIKGYVFPGTQKSGIKQFVLCRDNGDCCFGGQPKLTDRIQVSLQGPLSLNYSTKLQRLAGTFHVRPGTATDGLGGVIYHLDADYLK